jgi:hypothetical protein
MKSIILKSEEIGLLFVAGLLSGADMDVIAPWKLSTISAAEGIAMTKYYLPISDVHKD